MKTETVLTAIKAGATWLVTNWDKVGTVILGVATAISNDNWTGAALTVTTAMLSANAVAGSKHKSLVAKLKARNIHV
jgi:hypothetical protein